LTERRTQSLSYASSFQIARMAPRWWEAGLRSCACRLCSRTGPAEAHAVALHLTASYNYCVDACDQWMSARQRSPLPVGEGSERLRQSAAPQSRSSSRRFGARRRPPVAICVFGDVDSGGDAFVGEADLPPSVVSRIEYRSAGSLRAVISALRGRQADGYAGRRVGACQAVKSDADAKSRDEQVRRARDR